MTEFADEYIFVSKFFNVICRFFKSQWVIWQTLPGVMRSKAYMKKSQLGQRNKKHHLPISRGKNILQLRTRPNRQLPVERLSCNSEWDCCVLLEALAMCVPQTCRWHWRRWQPGVVLWYMYTRSGAEKSGKNTAYIWKRKHLFPTIYHHPN